MASPDVSIRIGAELREFKAALNQVRGDMATLARQAQTTSRGGSGDFGMGRVREDIKRAGSALKGFVASVGAAFAATKVAAIADEFTTITARLKLATDGAEDFNKAFGDVFEIAQKSRTPLKEVADLYSKLRTNAGLAADSARAVTEVIANAAAISGGGASAEAGIFQLNQALASGVLRGEELNSVLEQTPRIAKAIADGMGVAIGDLRNLAADGKLSADVVIAALMNEQHTIESELASIPVTISGAFTQLSNSITKFIGEADQASGASRQVASAIQFIAAHLPEIAAGFILVAKVVGAYLIAFRAIPAVYAAAQLAAGGLATANLTLAASFAAAQTAAARFMLVMKLIGGVVMAAFTGWQIGTYLREQFLEVELMGIALVRGLLVAWERLKQGTAIAFEGVKLVALAPLNFIRERIADLLDAFAAANEKFGGSSAAAKAARDLAASMRPAAGAVEGFNSAVAKINADSAAEIARMDAIFNSMVDDAIAARTKAGKKTEGGDLEAIQKEQCAKAGGKWDGKSCVLAGALSGSADLGTLKKRNDEAFRLAQDALQRETDALDQALEDRRISIAEWYAEKNLAAEQSYDIQRAALERERADQAAHLAALGAASASGKDKGKADKAALDTKAEIARIDADLVILERERASTLSDIGREATAKEREYQGAIAETREALLRARGQDLEAQLSAIDRARDEARRRFQGDQGALDLTDQLFDAEKAKAKFEDLRRQFDKIIAESRARQESIANQVKTGSLSGSTADSQVRADRQETLTQLDALTQKMQALAAEANNPAISEGAAASTAALQNLAIQSATGMEAAAISLRASLDQMRQDMASTIASDAVNGLTGMFYNIATGAKSAGEAFKDMIRGFVQSLAQMAARALATWAILSVIPEPYRSAIGGMMKISASVNHTGGVIGRGGASRSVDPLLFAAAPRYHSGGVVGLAPDEMPAVLKKGEEVLTASDPRHRDNGGAAGGQGGGTRIINVIDPSLVSDYLTSSAGEKSILNILQRNSGAVKQSLA